MEEHTLNNLAEGRTSEYCNEIEYNRPTLCTDYHSFIYYSGARVINKGVIISG
jgi:hypothetical protein